MFEDLKLPTGWQWYEVGGVYQFPIYGSNGGVTPEYAIFAINKEDRALVKIITISILVGEPITQELVDAAFTNTVPQQYSIKP